MSWQATKSRARTPDARVHKETVAAVAEIAATLLAVDNGQSTFAIIAREQIALLRGPGGHIGTSTAKHFALPFGHPATLRLG